MTTAEDLRARRETALAETRRQERADARLVLVGVAVRYRLTPGQARQLLDICGLLGDEDEGVPALQPYAFNQPGEHANLSRPAAGTYR